MLPYSLFTSLCFLLGSTVAFPDDDSDLTTFVTRPEIKAPKFAVTVHNEEHVSPGYWFVAPYWQIRPEEPSNRYMPCQIGPHIYDANGVLIWSGACRFKNSNVFDFHTVEINNETYISYMHNNAVDLNQNRGYGQILDNQYHVEGEVPAPDYVNMFNMHEFNVINNGKTALSNLYKPREVDMSDLGINAKGWVVCGGIFESDVETGDVLFQWDGYDHIPLNESTGDWPAGPLAEPGFDYVHVNAVDKTPDGDYLLSARFTDTIYKISAESGNIIWRLGGKGNDFDMTNFKFRRQHHVRHVESNSTHMTISILNNASDEGSEDGSPSAAQVITLDESSMTATLIAHYDRPDGDLTRLRGSAQLLPDGNVFVGWSAQGYQSEFTHDGELVMEAKFVSDRFSSYRSYKGQWSAKPTTSPAVKSKVFGATTEDVTTTIWVSWNGATDIASWNFYGLKDEQSSPVLIGNSDKTDFETMFMTSGYMGWIVVEALDADGGVLGKSEIQESEAPGDWKASGFDPDEEKPTPIDPKVFMEKENENKTEDQTAIDTELSVSKPGDDTDESTDDDDSSESNQSFSEAVSTALQSSSSLRVFCIAMLVVLIGGVLFGVYWFAHPFLSRSRKSYKPIASEEDGDSRVMREINNA